MASSAQLLEAVWQFSDQMALRGISDPRDFADRVMQRRQLAFDERRGQLVRALNTSGPSGIYFSHAVLS